MMPSCVSLNEHQHMKEDSKLILGSNKDSHSKGEAMGPLRMCAEGLETFIAIVLACSLLPPMWQGEGLHKSCSAGS